MPGAFSGQPAAAEPVMPGLAWLAAERAVAAQAKLDAEMKASLQTMAADEKSDLPPIASVLPSPLPATTIARSAPSQGTSPSATGAPGPSVGVLPDPIAPPPRRRGRLPM
jgi:hypothetical protein